MNLGRISVDHRIMGGVPCVAGPRIPVATVVGLVANGLTTDEIVAEHPQLTRDDVQAYLEYAARAVVDHPLTQSPCLLLRGHSSLSPAHENRGGIFHPGEYSDYFSAQKDHGYGTCACASHRVNFPAGR